GGAYGGASADVQGAARRYAGDGRRPFRRDRGAVAAMEPSAIERGPHGTFAAGLRAGEACAADESTRQIVATAHGIAQFLRGVALQIEEFHCGEITLVRAH